MEQQIRTTAGAEHVSSDSTRANRAVCGAELAFCGLSLGMGSTTLRMHGDVSAWLRYGVAAGVAVAVALTRYAVGQDIASIQPFAFFYVATTLVAWWAGLGPAIVLTALGLIAGVSFFLPQPVTWSAVTLVPSAVYLINSACFIALARIARRSQVEQTRAHLQLRGNAENLHQLLNNLLVYVGVMKPDGTLVEINGPPLQSAGIVADQVLGRKLWETYWWDYSAESAKLAHEAVSKAAGGEVVRFDALVRMAGDSRMWIDFQLAPLRDREGRISQLIASATDVTARRNAENALRVSEARFYETFARAPVGMAIGTLEGRVVHANQALCELTGYSEEQLIAPTMDIRSLTHPEDLEKSLEAYRRLIAGEIPAFFLEKRYIRKDGKIVWVRASGALRRGIGDEPPQVIALVEDITERKRVEEEAYRANTLIRAITEHTGDVIFAKDRGGRLTFANPATLQLVGKPLTKVLGRTDMELLNDKTAASMIMANDARIMNSGVAEDLEELVPLPDGTRRVWYSRKIAYRDDAGNVIGLLGVSRDITARKLVEEKLKASEAKHRALAQVLDAERAKLRAVIDNLPVGVTIADANGRPLVMNPFGLRLHGLTSQAEMLAVRDRHASEFVLSDVNGTPIPPERWPRALAASGQYVQDQVIRLRQREGGAERIVAMTSVPIRDSHGNPQLVVYVMHDLTEQLRSEQALAEARDQLARHATLLEQTVSERTAELRETVHELEAFSYSLSHDMRAPLRAMRGFAQILEEEYGSQIGHDGVVYLQRISRAAGRLDQLIRDVLTYSRIVRDQIVLQPIDLEKLVRQLVDENPALQPPYAVISIQSPLHAALGHEAYLMQVVSNLVYNAVKFVRSGEQPRVRIWTESGDSDVRLFVEDNGIGIPKEAQERMFGMFQRLHNDNAYEGTGIGLTIVRKAVERMGGAVGIISEPGQGSTFWVNLRKP